MNADAGTAGGVTRCCQDDTPAAGSTITHLPPSATAGVVQGVSTSNRASDEQLSQIAPLRANCGGQELSGSPEAPGSELRAR